MALPQLPHDIWAQVIRQYLLRSTLKDCLDLRCVNSEFSEEILRQLFTVQIIDLRTNVRDRRVPRHIAIRQLQGFFGRPKVPLKSQRGIRRTILRMLDLNPHDFNSINDTCFSYRPEQECLANLVGSSSSTRVGKCKVHDLMHAMIATFGSSIFTFGADVDEDYDGALPKDVRYWRLLTVCYRNDQETVRSLLQELIADEKIDEVEMKTVFADCFLISTRQDYPDMFKTLFEEAPDPEASMSLQSYLGRREANFNCLDEAIFLGRSRAMEIMLKAGWKFHWPYGGYIKSMLYGALQADRQDLQETRERLLRIMLTWTENWRNIAEMKQVLVDIGKHHGQRFLEILIEILRSQHFFRHERGEEGAFTPAEPLWSLSNQGNLEIIRLYLANCRLLLPHTTEEEQKQMRRYVLEREFDRGCGIRVEVVKLLVDYSQDLVDEKQDLQRILACQYDQKLANWAWLAKMVGLHTLCKEHGNQTLGSVILGRAVNRLNVETVRFLVHNGAKLSQEASTFQVYEDDEDAMRRLLMVRELLNRADQGEYKERRVIETTFTPITSTSRRRKRNHLPQSTKPLTRTRSASATAKVARSCPRFLRRSLNFASRKADTIDESRNGVMTSAASRNPFPLAKEDQ